MVNFHRYYEPLAIHIKTNHISADNALHDNRRMTVTRSQSCFQSCSNSTLIYNLVLRVNYTFI